MRRLPRSRPGGTRFGITSGRRAKLRRRVRQRHPASNRPRRAGAGASHRGRRKSDLGRHRFAISKGRAGGQHHYLPIFFCCNRFRSMAKPAASSASRPVALPATLPTSGQCSTPSQSSSNAPAAPPMSASRRTGGFHACSSRARPRRCCRAPTGTTPKWCSAPNTAPAPPLTGGDRLSYSVNRPHPAHRVTRDHPDRRARL